MCILPQVKWQTSKQGEELAVPSQNCPSMPLRAGRQKGPRCHGCRGAGPLPGSHPAGVTPKPTEGKSHPGLPPLCFHSLATPRSLSCPFWQPGKHEKTANSKKVCLCNLDRHLFLFQSLGPCRAQICSALDAGRQVQASIISLIMELQWGEKKKRGEVVSTLEIWQTRINLQRKQYWEMWQLGIPLMTEVW